MKNKYKILAIIGKSACGKDTLLKEILKINKEVNPIISCTTRPARENEIDGIDYNFISTDDFASKMLNNEMLEASCFNNWFYGTSISSLSIDKVNIGVFNPDGIDAMLEQKDLIDLYVYCLETDDKTRLIRQLNRETNPDIDEIFRRYQTDRKDFENLDFHYNYLTSNDETDMKRNVEIINAALRRLGQK